MKRVICLLILVFLLIPNTSFAEWLGWGEMKFVLVYKTDKLGGNAPKAEDLQKMVRYGHAIMVDSGTKCYVIKKKNGSAKVRITSGTQQGYIGWVYIESLKE